MKRSPPRVAAALLRHFVADEGLAGDVLEEFDSGRSRLWLWRQVLAAVVTDRSTRSREIRPLRLVDGESSFQRLERPRARASQLMTLTTAPKGSPVGGLGIVSLAVLVTVVLPHAWWLLVGSVMGGVLLGIGLVVVSRHRVQSSPSTLRDSS